MKMNCPNHKGEKDSWQGWKETEHEFLGTPKGYYQSTIGRGGKMDMRTMRCTECGHVQDWDFAKD